MEEKRFTVENSSLYSNFLYSILFTILRTEYLITEMPLVFRNIRK